MKHALGVMVFVILGLFGETPAQEFRITQVDGGVYAEWLSGWTISKNGIRVEFQSIRDLNGRVVSYRHEKAGIESLQKGDRIALYITMLKVSGSFPNFKDTGGEKVVAVPWRLGAWRIVTIESVLTTPTGATVKIKEKLNLEKIKSVSELTFQLKNGCLTDITGN